MTKLPPTTRESSELPSSTAILQQVLMARACPPGSALGVEFTETELSRAAGVSTVTVREFLINLADHGLIERQPGNRWRMCALDPVYAEELLDTLETFELKAMEQIARLPPGDPAFDRLGRLLARHETSATLVAEPGPHFHQLEREFHACLVGLLNNRFVTHLIDVVTMVLHYRRQWNLRGSEATERAARQEHVSILRALVARDMPAAICALSAHLHRQRSALLDATRCSNMIADRQCHSWQVPAGQAV